MSLIDNYLKEIDWQTKENANMSYSLQGLRNYISNEITKDYWLNKLYPEEIKKAHLIGDFHIHDLGDLASYCVGWDLQDLLTQGFSGVASKVNCRPAKHFDAILGQIVNFIFTLQGEVAGAQAFSNFDTLLAPFIRYDNLNYNQVKQSLQSFIYNLNVPTRVGFQTPFSNLTLDLTVPSTLADHPVIIGGKYMEKSYKDFQAEMDILNQAFAEVMLEGDANGRIFTFPIPTYNITKDFNWNKKEYEPIWEMTAKYGIPYFTNYLNSDLSPEDARSMCCRLRLDNRELRKRGGGLFGANPLTGSIGVVTINLPRLGHISDSLPEFYSNLDRVLNLAKESLIIKRGIIENYTDKGLYPYTKFYLSKIKEKQGKYWANHFATIGLIGMNELLLNLIDEDITSNKGQKLAEQVLDFMRDRILKFQEETKELFNLEATPAEATSYRLARLDKQEFTNSQKLNFANEDKNIENPYYTNSSQLPVYFTDDLFTALDLQDNLQTKYTGGTVFHSFLGEKINDIQALKNLVKQVFTNYKLPYFTLTPTFSICKNHGYLNGKQENCPSCGQKCEIYSRIVGYIRPVEQWNEGKKQEFKERLTFK